MAGLRDVCVVVGESFSAFEFSIGCEVFGIDRTDDGVPAFDFAVCSARPGPIRSQHGFSLSAEHRYDRLARADLVILTPSREVDRLVDPELERQLRAALARGATVASFCSAAFVLARCGLLDGLRATTHYRYAARLAAEYPAVEVVPDVLYVEAPTAGGLVATSAGTAAGIDLCLHLVRREFGATVATAVARRMVVAPHRDGGQAQFVTAPIRPCADTSLQQALVWATTHLDTEIDVAGWAAQAMMSPRTFARRFRAETGVTPHRWLLEQRLATARLLLEQGQESIDEVSRRCGFGSAATLRHHFLRGLGTTPTAYRRTYQGARTPEAIPLQPVLA